MGKWVCFEKCYAFDRVYNMGDTLELSKKKTRLAEESGVLLHFRKFGVMLDIPEIQKERASRRERKLQQKARNKGKRTFPSIAPKMAVVFAPGEDEEAMKAQVEDQNEEEEEKRPVGRPRKDAGE